MIASIIASYFGMSTLSRPASANLFNRAPRSQERLDAIDYRQLEIEVGDQPTTARSVKLVLVSEEPSAKPSHWKLRSEDGALEAVVTKSTARPDIALKDVAIRNVGTVPLRILNVVLARIPLKSQTAEGGDRGFPVYLNKEFFATLAHPAGFAHVEGKEVVLRQYPGFVLPAGRTLQCMQAVFGHAKPGQARKLFVDYVRSRMARVKYHHDKPYAILEAFGGQQEGDFRDYYARGVSEDYLHRHLLDVTEAQRQSRAKFDFYSIEFWHDRAGDFTGFSKPNFPNGFDRVRQQILGVGMKPGLWIASSGTPDWTIDLNPAVRNCFNVGPGVGEFCRASEPLNQIYKDGFRSQMSHNHVGLLKFDNLAQNCVNPAHEHLPGPHYSTEAIYNGVIDFLQTLRQANPDVFLMLYWGYRSPWWLEYGDTYFECGDQIEAASPAQYPTPYARDAVTQRLDQAQLKITDTPWIGKDSLGVWLSNWTWNSSIGKDRWQEGVVMDMARGGMLFQMWTDEHWLTPPERAQVATFIDLMKSNPVCFDHCAPILGNPDRQEPYGYTCTDGKHAFLAIDNAALKDSSVPIELGPKIGLPAGQKWDVYRWYPRAAKLPVMQSASLTVNMRPYEVDLIEVVPRGSKPSLGLPFANVADAGPFAERTTEIAVRRSVDGDQKVHVTNWTILKSAQLSSALGAKLTATADGSFLPSGRNESYDTYTFDWNGRLDGLTAVLLETLPDPSLPGGGPGRAVNGNFALTKIEAQVRKKDGIANLPLIAAIADFSQTSFGGWPVTAAIDDDPKTGWSIHPRVGQAHAAMFGADISRTEQISDLKLTLRGGDNGHNLGRIRISITDDPQPALPKQYQPGVIALEVTIPPTKSGGLFLLDGGNQDDVPVAVISGNLLPLKSVWAAQSNWACPWTAWRAAVGPSKSAKTIKIELKTIQTIAGASFHAHFIPW